MEIIKDDRVRISGPVQYGDAKVHVNSEALVLGTTKRRVLATVDNIAGEVVNVH